MSATPPDVSRRAPQLGEHTDEVLVEAGYSASEIGVLRSAHAIA
jgi:crotonobetainyl-CoA:carnitine CoA-transferase CaiB-like acyl-CoA transferase